MKRTTLAAVAIILGLAAAAWAVTRPEEAQVEAPPTAAVTRGDIEDTVLATGSVEAQKLVSVGAQVSGRIENLPLQVGDRVSAGDLVAEIDSLDQQNAVARAEAALAQVDASIAARQASLDEAVLALDRRQRLAAKDFATSESLEAAQASLKLARAEVAGLQAQRRMAEVELAAARLDLERTRITSPASGTVVAVVTGEGQTVVSAQQAPVIVKIAELDRVVIKADVSEADVVNVKAGQKARFTLLGAPGEPYEAVVQSVEPAPAAIAEKDEIPSDEAVYYRARLEVDNTDGVKRIGMTVQVTITIAEAKDVPRVLKSALGRPDEEGVYTVEVWNPATRTREERKVTIGLDDGVLAEVKSGLAEGDLVVTDRTSGQSAAMQMRRPPGLPGF